MATGAVAVWASAQQPPGAPSPGGTTQGVPVQISTARRQDVPVLLRNIATVQAFASALVRARVDGTLDKLYFTEGQDIQAGAPLAQIDPRPFIAAYAQADAKRAADVAQLANAKRDLTRYSNLARNEFASRQQVDTQGSTVDQLQANIKGDEAALATAKLNIDYANITSPISGRTGIRFVDPGNLIHASDATGIVTVTQIHPISVLFTLPQDDLPQIQAAAAKGTLPVTAYASDDRTRLSDGTLLTVDNQIDTATGTIRLKATFPNTDNKLWPGQFINARLQVGTLRDAVTIPSVGVEHGPNGLFVFLLKPGSTVGLQPVEVAQDDGVTAVIAKGVDDGAQVVTNGQSRLQNGTKVAIVNAPKTAS